MEEGPSYRTHTHPSEVVLCFLPLVLQTARRVASGTLEAALLTVCSICIQCTKSQFGFCWNVEDFTSSALVADLIFFFGSRTSLLGFMLLLKDNVCLNNFLTHWLVSHYVLCPPFL